MSVMRNCTRDIAMLLCVTLGVVWVIAGIAVAPRSGATAQDYAVESVPLAIAPPGVEAGGPRPRQLLVVRVLRRPCSDAVLRDVGHDVRQSLDAQGLRDVAAIVTADWLEVRLESVEGGR